NCIAMLAALPNWAADDKRSQLKTADGTLLRAAWKQPGGEGAKAMHDEDGNRAMLFPGKVPGLEDYFPDVERINPAYFQNMDRKVDYLNSQGLVPFIEVARRDIGQAWKRFYPWPESYARYIHYIFSRYQANICLLSPIHFDTPALTIPAADWNDAANYYMERYGLPPFGTMLGTNANPSSLENYGHVDQARWLSFHQIGNKRTHDVYEHLTKIFHTEPPVPAINGEPYYDGMEGIASGSDEAALNCRSAMYGSVLSGGLGGHIYGAGGWDGGLWGGNVEKEAENHIWDAIQWPSGDQMQHMGAFILSEGAKYQQLKPCREALSPHDSGPPKKNIGWAYAGRTADASLLLIYFEKDCPRATLSGLTAGASYKAQWFDPRAGEWLAAGDGLLEADTQGAAKLPPFPGSEETSNTDWALKLVRQ
ncbi:MAG: DUF4038 domain-containing protein, partial [Planctomycetota bacterium]